MEFSRFGNYILLKQLALGGMAEIYLAKQLDLRLSDRFVVIKRILKSRSKDPVFTKLFLKEAETASVLNHPNIAQVYDFGKVNEQYYIAFEYLFGENLIALGQQLNKLARPCPLSIALKIGIQVLKGLHYAHSLTDSEGKPLHIIHRDISPPNIFITIDGKVKIVDFGIALSDQLLDSNPKLVGTYAYMSPEQLQELEIDNRSDIFSLGIILYELSTSTRLFKSDPHKLDIDAILNKKIVKPSEIIPKFPPDLDRILMTALERKVENRYQTAKEMEIDLKKFLEKSDIKEGAAEIETFISDLFPDKIEQGKKFIEAIDLSRLETEIKNDKDFQYQISYVNKGTAVARIENLKNKTDALYKRLNIFKTVNIFLVIALVIAVGINIFFSIYYKSRLGHEVQRIVYSPSQNKALAKTFNIGEIEIASIPEKAQIFLNGKLLPIKTPAVITDLDIRVPHHVRVTKKGFRHVYQKFNLGEQQRRSNLFILSLLTKTAEKTVAIDLAVTPLDSEIFIDGKRYTALKGKIHLSLYQNQPYAIEVHKKGFQSRIERVLFEKPQTVQFDLSRIP